MVLCDVVMFITAGKSSDLRTMEITHHLLIILIYFDLESYLFPSQCLPKSLSFEDAVLLIRLLEEFLVSL